MNFDWKYYVVLLNDFLKNITKGIRADENIKNWMSIAMKMYDAWSISSNILSYSLHAMVHKIGFS